MSGKGKGFHLHFPGFIHTSVSYDAALLGGSHILKALSENKALGHALDCRHVRSLQEEGRGQERISQKDPELARWHLLLAFSMRCTAFISSPS